MDEFQDFSLLEVTLIRELSEFSPTLMVGDDDQALYEFRPARGRCSFPRVTTPRRLTQGPLDRRLTRVDPRSVPQLPERPFKRYAGSP